MQYSNNNVETIQPLREYFVGEMIKATRNECVKNKVLFVISRLILPNTCLYVHHVPNKNSLIFLLLLLS